MTTNYLVGIDGGGTKTEVLIADLDGKIIRRSAGSGTGLTTTDLGLAAFALRETLRLAFESLEPGKIAALVFGIAGLDTKEEEANVRQVFAESINQWQVDKFILLNDAMLALANGTQAKNAIVLVGGTGSNCLGYNEAGQKAKAGGLNWAISDDGSGFDAGRLALKATIKSCDGRGPKTLLEEKVLKALRIQTAGQLKDVIYRPLINKKEIASLAPLVVQAAQEGDTLAQAIIDYCLNELLLHVIAVAKHLDLQNRDFDLAVAGGFILHLLPAFKKKLQAALPKAHLVSADEAPVYGALKIAEKVIRQEDISRWLID